jgi:hypothetical protein
MTTRGVSVKMALQSQRDAPVTTDAAASSNTDRRTRLWVAVLLQDDARDLAGTLQV